MRVDENWRAPDEFEANPVWVYAGLIAVAVAIVAVAWLTIAAAWTVFG